METVAYIGLVVMFIGGIGTLIAAFKTSILWGIGCLLFAPVSLLFLIMHWQNAKNPFFLQLIGFGIIFLGASANGLT